MTKDTKAMFWLHHIKSCKGSSLSQKQYCAQHSLALATFTYWKRKLKLSQDEGQIRFYPVTVPPAKADSSRQGAGLSISFTENQWRVELAVDFSVPALKKLMNLLKES